MDIGMLWFDNDQKAGLLSKLKRATQYYQKKYGRKPNLCYLNPCMISHDGSETSRGNGEGVVEQIHEVDIKESISMLPNHFWIGVRKKEN